MYRHEHHYVDISDHLIPSDQLFDSSANVPYLLGTSKLILCTLSMLSNSGMYLYGVFDLVPVKRLVVDEASQIDTFEFMVRGRPGSVLHVHN